MFFCIKWFLFKQILTNLKKSIVYEQILIAEQVISSVEDMLANTKADSKEN